MMISHSTLCTNTLLSLIPGLGPNIRLKSSERSVKSYQHRLFGEVRQQLSGGHELSSFTYAPRAGEQSILIEEEPSQVLDNPSMKVLPGQAHPLGVSDVENGTNFAIFSQNATAVTLCLLLHERDQEMIELSLDPEVNKTGDRWHICVQDLPRSNVLYVYRVNGPEDWHQGHRFNYGNLLLDPYAKLIEGRRVFGDASNKMSNFFGTYDFDCLPFDWGENYKLPNIHEVKWTISGFIPSQTGSYVGNNKVAFKI